MKPHIAQLARRLQYRTASMKTVCTLCYSPATRLVALSNGTIIVARVALCDSCESRAAGGLYRASSEPLPRVVGDDAAGDVELSEAQQ
jgi:hypothetical protein